MGGFQTSGGQMTNGLKYPNFIVLVNCTDFSGGVTTNGPWVLLRTFESYVLSKICFIFTPKLGEDFPIVASMLIFNGWQNCFLYGYWIPMDLCHTVSLRLWSR